MKIIKEKIESNFNVFIEDLKALIRIPSVYEEDESPYPFGKNIDDALKEMLAISDKLGFDTFYDPRGYYGYAEYGNGDEMIGVLGHLDVVPPGDLKKWDTQPFSPTIKEGKLFGRGTQDDKGPTLGAMYALKAIMDSGVNVNKKVRFIYGTDEESLWRGIEEYKKKEKMPDYGFTPDADFPLIYAEKGLLQVNLVAKNETNIRLKGGDAYNSVPSEILYETKDADSLVEALEKLNFEYKKNNRMITVMGKSVHAKDAEKGINAICRLLIAMDKIGLKSKCIDFIVENILEDALAIKIFGECKDDVSGALKFNIGKINMDENNETLNIDIRIPVSIDKEFVLNKLSKVVQKYGFIIVENDYLKSIYTPLDSKLVQTLMEAYVEITGDSKSLPVSSGGATYARAMDRCVAFGAAFPYTEETEHQPNECIKLDEMKMAIEIYACALLKLLK
ncbi:Sapep family Mn(2+)-dependent dipeptidase [Marinisporobacter balticus]|uniref:Putative dipeptidase n=1 Tax=Marinisporobacter balticus TaxID=2018667 RepID=A0A4R2KTI6_9FIRM|nr:Sapep family Mn(2+)-dependent dipeptidase [Marinisporobacter balticus]TCO74389.1 putative dipeptidase [Marinisporobacter balticus]